MEMFQALNFCRVQSAPPSFLMVILQNSKILLSRWPAPIFLGKIAEWILETLGFQLLGDLPGEAAWSRAPKKLRDFSVAALPGSFFQACTLQASGETKTTSGHKQGKKEAFWLGSSLFVRSFENFWLQCCFVQNLKKKKKLKLLNYSLRCLTLPMVLTNLNYIFILGHEINDYINEWMLLHLIDLSSHWTGSCFQGF